MTGTRLAIGGVALGLAAATALGAVAPSHAQTRTQPGFDVPVCAGEISSFPLDEIASGQSYWVDIFDPTDEALRFREIFLASIVQSGRTTDEEGRLVFSFESESSFLGLVPRSGGGQTVLGSEARRDPGRQAGISELRDTIREERSARDGRSNVAPRIDAKAELRDRATGRVVWLATLTCRPLTADRELLMEFVSAKIVERLGAEGGKSSFR